MQRHMFTGKIHRCTVTHADLDYEGSVSIDKDLMDAAGIVQNEEVRVWNVTTGARLETYALAAPSGSGVICLNGAAAHLFQPGHLAIIATFGILTEEEVLALKPKVVFVDAQNRIKEFRDEVAGPRMPQKVEDA